MASGYNRVVMVGNLTRDPELKQLSSGQSVCRLNVASNRQYKNRQSGEMVQEVCYVDIDVWGPQADSSNQYLEKGRQVLVEGRLKLDTWQDNDGNNRSKHSIVADRVVFLSSGQQDAGASQSQEKDAYKPKTEAEKNVMSQLDSVKKRAASAQTNDFSGQGQSQAAFKDEPPFQDDLPF